MRLKKVLTGFRNRLIAGIFVATPLVATIWLLTVAYRFIAQVSAPLLEVIILRLAENPQLLLQDDRRLLIEAMADLRWLAFLITVGLVFLLGFLATNVFGKRLIEGIEAFIMRIPIAATIYTGIKQITDSVSQFHGNMQFKRVAYVQYPSDECRLLGFVTGQFWDDDREENMTCIFIPTSPNPMTGFVVVVPDRKVMEANLTMEQATKLILSAGLVGPRFPMPAGQSRPRRSVDTTGDPALQPEYAPDTPLAQPVSSDDADDSESSIPLPQAVRVAQFSSAPSAKAKRDAIRRQWGLANSATDGEESSDNDFSAPSNGSSRSESEEASRR